MMLLSSSAAMTLMEYDTYYGNTKQLSDFGFILQRDHS